MASLTERQQEFVQRNSTIQPFWGEVEDICIFSAALLTLGINPSALNDEMDAYGEPVSADELPDDFLPRIEVLCSAIRAGSLNTVTLICDQHQRIDENRTRVRTKDFADWCDNKGIPHNLPDYDSPRRTDKWPWGTCRSVRSAAPCCFTCYPSCTSTPA